MHHAGNYIQFSCINNSLQCYNENEDCEPAVSEKIVYTLEEIVKRMIRPSMNE
jgi:hypothetical protein